MYTAEYEGINSFLTGSCRLLLSEARKRETRGNTCYELSEPYMFKIKNPCARHITIPQRKWFKTLPYAESLWLASGRNDMDFITYYLERMNEFSDDKVMMRGGYGPRFRHYNGLITDYVSPTMQSERKDEADQFRYVVECFKAEMNTRRAIISIGDPMKDCFDENHLLKRTNDIPCTRMLQFIKQPDTNKLNLIVTMRSNDIIWGASAVNIFTLTFIQEYFSAILGLEVGDYIHISNNMHYYDRHSEMIQELAGITDVEDVGVPLQKQFHSLKEFDESVHRLVKEEGLMRLQGGEYQKITMYDEFFQNWYDVLYQWHIRKINRLG